MGIAASWMSVKGASKAEVLKRLRLEETGRTLSLAEDWFDGYRTEIGIAELKSRRVLLVSSHSEFLDPERVAEASAGAEVVMGLVEEHVMHSEAVGYVDGREVWRVAHLPEGGSAHQPNGVEVSGELPPEFAEAIAKGERGFELPAAVCGMIGGYRPDVDLPGFDNMVTVLTVDQEAEWAAQDAERAARKAAWRASGGVAGALKRMFGGG